jgi:hypothetical protein
LRQVGEMLKEVVRAFAVLSLFFFALEQAYPAATAPQGSSVAGSNHVSFASFCGGGGALGSLPQRLPCLSIQRRRVAATTLYRAVGVCTNSCRILRGDAATIGVQDPRQLRAFPRSSHRLILRHLHTAGVFACGCFHTNAPDAIGWMGIEASSEERDSAARADRSFSSRAAVLADGRRVTRPVGCYARTTD